MPLFPNPPKILIQKSGVGQESVVLSYLGVSSESLLAFVCLAGLSAGIKEAVCVHMSVRICTWPTLGAHNPSHLWWAGKEWAWGGLERKLMPRVRWVKQK